MITTQYAPSGRTRRQGACSVFLDITSVVRFLFLIFSGHSLDFSFRSFAHSGGRCSSIFEEMVAIPFGTKHGVRRFFLESFDCYRRLSWFKVSVMSRLYRLRTCCGVLWQGLGCESRVLLFLNTAIPYGLSIGFYRIGLSRCFQHAFTPCLSCTTGRPLLRIRIATCAKRSACFRQFAVVMISWLKVYFPRALTRASVSRVL